MSRRGKRVTYGPSTLEVRSGAGGAAIVASLALVGVYLAAGGVLLRRRRRAGPVQAAALAQSRRACRKSPSSSRSRRSTAPPASSGSRARRWPGRWHAGRRASASPSATGSATRSWREAVRAGLVRAVDDAEEAGALSPLVAAPLRGTSRKSRWTRRSNWSRTPAPCSATSRSLRPGRRTAGRPAAVRICRADAQSRVARQTQSIASGCSGSRAHSAQRGIRSRSSPRTCSGLTAMWTLAGKTASSSASSHQRAKRRVRGWSDRERRRRSRRRR